MDPRFTVLLPTHNRADVVGFAISSVLRQADPDFELLVVGDGCTDSTASVVQAFGDTRIRWLDYPKSPDFGYANRNRALREARGALIAFAAHDDLLLPDHLSLLGQTFDDADVEWAYSRPLWVSDDGLMVPFAVDLRKPPDLDRFMHVVNTIPASCVVYRRGCLERYGYWPEDSRSSGDHRYWKRIIGPSAGANVAYVPAATTLHFRASWRSKSAWGPPPLPAWLEVARTSWWPAQLRFAIPNGVQPQAHFHGLIESRPQDWPTELRAGITEAMDELAWTAGIDRGRRIAKVARGFQNVVDRVRGRNGILRRRNRTSEPGRPPEPS